jgi:peroxiredoxin Q/BCP
MFGIRKRVFGAAQAVLRPAALLGAGSEAPEWDLETHDGERVRSEDLKGKKNYILIFYPGDDTPGCTRQLQEFSALKDRFAACDGLVFGVNDASKESHSSFVSKCSLSTPLLVDTDRALATAFNTARPGVPRIFRAVFAVDKKGIVRGAMKDFPDPEAMLRVVQRREETGFKGTGRKGRQLAPEVSHYGVSKIQGNDPKTVVLDIRDVVDWEAGHIPGALSIPIDWLIQRMEELPGKSTPIILVCDQGLRSPSAARMLSDNGWRKLYVITDGMLKFRGPWEKGPDARAES